jgi:phosphoglycolate phosphatase-like HAD superfamily hydrolase
MISELQAPYLVFDFDGTIVYLDVDWALLKEELRRLANDQVSIDEPFKSMNEGLARLKSLSEKTFISALQVIRAHELNGFKGRINSPIVEYIKNEISSDQKISIFSGNSEEVIATIIDQLGIRSNFIVGREQLVETPKPSPAGLLSIVRHYNARPETAIWTRKPGRQAGYEPTYGKIFGPESGKRRASRHIGTTQLR